MPPTEQYCCFANASAREIWQKEKSPNCRNDVGDLRHHFSKWNVFSEAKGTARSADDKLSVWDSAIIISLKIEGNDYGARFSFL